MWRFGYEREALWRRVIRAKYGVEEGNWCSNPVPGSYGVSLWKTISSGWFTFSCYVQFQIGEGTRVKFWHDVWCGDNPLSTCFLDLFRISNDKEAYVVDLIQFSNGVFFWDLEFLREIHDRESYSLSVFWNVIYKVSLRGIGEDKMRWTPAKSKGFEVSSYYQALLGVCTQSFPWRSIWKQKVPSRVAFFVWIADLGTILTIDNLCKKKVLILDWCYMCKSNGELVDHLYYIVVLFMSCGLWCSPCLVSIGRCQRL